MTGDRPDGGNGLERRLVDSLHGHLDTVTASTDLTAAAVSQARRLRRNRAILTGVGAVVAALAVASPFALGGLRDDGTLIDPGPARTASSATSSATSPATTPATSSGPSTATTTRGSGTTAPPTATASRTTAPPTPAPTYDADSAPLATARPSLAGSSGSPDVSHVHGTTVRDLTRDREVTLAVAPGSQLGSDISLFADGAVLGSVLAGGDWEVVVWDGVTGAERARLGRGSVLAINSDHTLASYVDASERLHIIASDGDVVATAPRAGLLAEGIVGDTVFVNDIRSEPVRGYTWNVRTGALKGFDGRFGAAHEGAGLVVFLPEGGTGGDTCFRLLDADDLAARWTACGDFFPSAFSPSGELLIGGSGSDGGSPHDLWVMRTSDAARILHVDSGANGLLMTGSAIDARDRAVTVVAHSETLDEALLRCPLDGSSCTVVGAPERLDTGSASGMSPPAWLVMR
ncbi:hypothetical protein [Intrasporangium sp.]|uniref:hypothetical protein n=1 Tax=Intrasporangium sp. TaxID=1925024 RepID=UPI00293B40E4|nr:hypothetical protein [Intrasporangium sp.]MDV3221747.1 hypothetical protein [Intrasporangium sp.]